MRVYLAGPITGMSYKGAVDWREAVAKQLKEWGHTALSPMRGKTYLADQTNIKAWYQMGAFPMSSAKGIYGRDKFDVYQCDVTLAHLAGATKVSIGTLMEIQRAHDLNKYVLVTMEEEGNPHDHPFVREAASLVVPDLETAMEILYWLGGGNG